MGQHQLLSPAARSLPVDQFHRDITENEFVARVLFQQFRWGQLATQTCPRCGVIDSHWWKASKGLWRCTGCRHDFSVTAGSLFDGTKLPLWKVIKALQLFVTNAKGRSAIELSHLVNVSYKTAYLLVHKLRWAFFQQQLPDGNLMHGEFEVDVVWVMKGLRDFNDRTPGAHEKRRLAARERLARNLRREGMDESGIERMLNKTFPSGTKPHRPPNPKKQCVLAIARRGPNGKGCDWVTGIALQSENYADIARELQMRVAPGSVVYSDSASASVALAAHYDVRRIYHDKHYALPGGTHTNFVESVFARWRRMEMGSYHRMSKPTLELFFAECAWREMSRELGSAERLRKALGEVARAAVCVRFRKYGGVRKKEAPPRSRPPRRRHVAPSAERGPLTRLGAMLKLPGALRAQLLELDTGL